MTRFASYPSWRPYLGHLVVPKSRNRLEPLKATGLPIYCDNGAYAGFDDRLWREMVGQFMGVAEWFTVPDWVGSARMTYGLCDWYTGGACPVDLADMDESAFPLAFVAQDGITDMDMADVWHCGFIRCLFIGGSTDFKLSRSAADMARHAKGLGWTVHMGRVNSLKRIEYAHSIGCDTVDGSGYSRFADTHVPGAVKLMMQLAGDINQMGVSVPKRLARCRMEAR